MWWHHRRYAKELAEAGKQLEQVRKQGRSIKEFTDWVGRHLEENHFAERMLLGLDPAPPQRRHRRKRGR